VKVRVPPASAMDVIFPSVSKPYSKRASSAAPIVCAMLPGRPVAASYSTFVAAAFGLAMRVSRPAGS
jgi:hypothetical protein